MTMPPFHTLPAYQKSVHGEVELPSRFRLDALPVREVWPHKNSDPLEKGPIRSGQATARPDSGPRTLPIFAPYANVQMGS